MDLSVWFLILTASDRRTKTTSNDARCTFNSLILLDVNRNRIKFNFIVKRDHVIVSTSKLD